LKDFQFTFWKKEDYQEFMALSMFPACGTVIAIHCSGFGSLGISALPDPTTINNLRSIA